MTNIKIVLIGDTNVGKTSLIHRYLENQSTSKDTTFNNYTYHITYKKKPIVLNIWDTSGKTELKKLRSLSYPYTDVFIICYAIDNMRSLNNIHSYMQEIKELSAKKLIVGCKNDIRDDRVTNGDIVKEEKGEEMARFYGVDAMCCSAEDGTNVREVFGRCVQLYGEPKEGQKKKAWWRCLCCAGEDL